MAIVAFYLLALAIGRLVSAALRKASPGRGYDRLMATTKDTAWERHALEALGEAGYRRGGARTAVVEALARHDCAVTALELEDELRRRKLSVGRASVYRALERAGGAAAGAALRGGAGHRQL